MASEAWQDEHYPRCTRCGLRTFVHNFTGRRVDWWNALPSCPAWHLPESERPAYPWIGSEHEVAQ